MTARAEDGGAAQPAAAGSAVQPCGFFAFRDDSRLRKALADKVRAERPALDELLKAASDGDHPSDVGDLAERSSRLARVGAELPELRRTERLAVRLETLATTCSHLWPSRLCRAYNRLHEYVTYALLACVHEARAAVRGAR